MIALRPALAAFAVCAAGPALAQSVTAAYPETVVAAMQDAGYKATLTTDTYGDPKIESATNGVSFSVYFYGCDEGTACRDIQFTAGFNLDNGLSLESINSWNSEKLVGHAYVDDEMDPFVTHFVSAVDGMPRANFEEVLDAWDTALAEFTDFIDW